MGLFKRPKESVRKWDGQHFTFSNFSYGLYCLDTPRSTPEQLSNLALTGGRNIWSERGALTNQYGYSIKGQLDDDDLPFMITSDSKNSTGVLVLCLNGSVYRYTSLEGLKKYKTIVEYFDDTTCIAYNGANLYFTGNDSKYVFGGRYNDETDTDVTFESIVSDIEITSSNGFFTILCTEEDLKYYWLDKKLCMIISGQEDYLNITC